MVLQSWELELYYDNVRAANERRNIMDGADSANLWGQELEAKFASLRQGQAKLEETLKRLEETETATWKAIREDLQCAFASIEAKLAANYQEVTTVVPEWATADASDNK